VPDFKIMAMYKNDGNGDIATKTMPTSGYDINSEKSYCTLDNINKDTSIKLYTNASGEHIISGLSKSSKCYLYFDKSSGITEILTNNKLILLENKNQYVFRDLKNKYLIKDFYYTKDNTYIILEKDNILYLYNIKENSFQTLEDPNIKNYGNGFYTIAESKITIYDLLNNNIKEYSNHNNILLENINADGTYVSYDDFDGIKPQIDILKVIKQ